MELNIPPPYETGTQPPSYEQLIQRYDSIVGDEPTPEKCFAAIDNFTSEEIDIIAASEDRLPPPAETPEEKKKFWAAAMKALCEDEYTAHGLEESTKNTTDAIMTLRTIFAEVSAAIDEVDKIMPSGFSEPMRVIKQEYDAIVRICCVSALTIEKDGRILDTFMPLFTTSNDEIPLDWKKEELNKIIKNAPIYKKSGEDMKEKLAKIQTDYRNLASGFSSWAKEKEEEIGMDIRQIEEALRILQARLVEVEEKISIVKIALAATATMGIFGWFAGPIGAILAVAGLAGVAISAALLVSYRKKRDEINANIARLNEELGDKKERLELIQKARTSLVEVRDRNQSEVTNCFTIVDAFWGMVEQSAIQLLEAAESQEDYDELNFYPYYAEEAGGIFGKLATAMGSLGRDIAGIIGVATEQKQDEGLTFQKRVEQAKRRALDFNKRS